MKIQITKDGKKLLECLCFENEDDVVLAFKDQPCLTDREFQLLMHVIHKAGILTNNIKNEDSKEYKKAH